MITTLRKIIPDCLLFKSERKKLLDGLGKNELDDEPLTIETILNISGIETALICLRAIEGHERNIRLLGVRIVEQVAPFITDERSLEALATAKLYAHGAATDNDLTLARAAAISAQRAARGKAHPAEYAMIAVQEITGPDKTIAHSVSAAATWASNAMAAQAMEKVKAIERVRQTELLALMCMETP